MKKVFKILLTLLTASNFLFAKEKENLVAKAILLKGNVQALGVDKKIIQLKQGSWVEEGAIIKTSDKSFVKLLFIDKSQMNLGAKSEMEIKTFPKKEAGIINLLKGQLRSKVTKNYMEIEEKNKSKLYIKTKTAAMGVRGTDFQVNYNPANSNTSLITFEGAVSMGRIAEDMSGIPGLGAAVESGGLGFTHRLAMGIPDFWIKYIKEKTDELWNVSEIFYQLTNKRPEERTISYAESHDQALVGDKTLIFRLADKEMYTHMAKSQDSLIIDRAMALHKLIRLITLCTHGGGYLNFMGNEFGHPEWIDFPREGNNWSYHYARRQWSLADNDVLRYQELKRFDEAMLSLANSGALSLSSHPESMLHNEGDQVLAFKRNDFLFVFNFNPTQSFTDYGIPCFPDDYKIVLHSDQEVFGGYNRVDCSIVLETIPVAGIGSEHRLMCYLPSRTAMVLQRVPTPSVRPK